MQYSKELSEVRKALKAFRETNDAYHKRVLFNLLCKQPHFKHFLEAAGNGFINPQAKQHATDLATDLLHVDETAERTQPANQ